MQAHNTPSSQLPNSNLYALRHWLVLLWVLAFGAFHLAWTAHDSAAFTLNGFDLANQIRIHPAILAESPTLRSSMLLWLAIPCVALGISLIAALYQDWLIRWTLRGGALLIALRLIPPERALRSPSTLMDDEYTAALTQLSILGVLLVVGGSLFGKRLLPFLTPIIVGIGVIGIILPIIGWNRGVDLLSELGVPVGLGGGLIIYVLCLGLLVGITVIKQPLFRR